MRIQAAVNPSSIRSRVVILAVSIGLAALAVAVRLCGLQIVDSESLRAQARRQHRQVIEIGGRRGSIVDREGREFAVSVTTQSLYAHPPRLRKDADRAARLLAPFLGRPESELKALLSSDEPFVWLKRRLDPATSRAIAKLDAKLVYKGGPIDFQPEPKRFYPQGELGVHVVVRVALRRADPVLLPVTGLLTGLGLTFIHRVAPDDARRQLLWVAVGLIALVAVVLLVRDHRRLERYPYLFGLAAIGLLLLPSVPGLGERVNGVRLWVELGPFRFQPGELAKLCLIVFLAGYLRDKREALTAGRLKDLGPLLVVWGAALVQVPRAEERRSWQRPGLGWRAAAAAFDHAGVEG